MKIISKQNAISQEQTPHHQQCMRWIQLVGFVIIRPLLMKQKGKKGASFTQPRMEITFGTPAQARKLNSSMCSEDKENLYLGSRVKDSITGKAFDLRNSLRPKIYDQQLCIAEVGDCSSEWKSIGIEHRFEQESTEHRAIAIKLRQTRDIGVGTPSALAVITARRNRAISFYYFQIIHQRFSKEQKPQSKNYFQDSLQPSKIIQKIGRTSLEKESRAYRYIHPPTPKSTASKQTRGFFYASNM